MCRLVNNLDFIMVNGFKVAVKENDKYYSPTTGIEYKRGFKVKVPEIQKNYVSKEIVDDLLEINSSSYKSNMVGRTCVFITKDNAMELFRSFKRSYPEINFVLLKMYLRNDLMIGDYSGGYVFGGKYIANFYEESV